MITQAVARSILGHGPALPPSQTDILTGPWLVPAVLVIVVCAPIGEELLFRGFLFQGLRRRFRMLPAAAISAGAFSFVHVYPLRIPPVFVSGLILALLYERRRSVLSPMVAHATLNAVVVASYLARRWGRKGSGRRTAKLAACESCCSPGRAGSARRPSRPRRLSALHARAPGRS